jgi:phage/plasmid-associated DNA primase
LGFENGVFDLYAGEFREGRPEDLVSLSTGVSFESEPGISLEEEIMDFFSKVFPDEELREYALGRLASFLSGDVSHEHFYIFTPGSTASPRPSSCSRPHSASTAASCRRRS